MAQFQLPPPINALGAIGYGRDLRAQQDDRRVQNQLRELVGGSDISSPAGREALSQSAFKIDPAKGLALMEQFDRMDERSQQRAMALKQDAARIALQMQSAPLEVRPQLWSQASSMYPEVYSGQYQPGAEEAIISEAQTFDQLLEERNKKAEAAMKPPELQKIESGGSIITYEWDPVTRSRVVVSKAPRWQPPQARQPTELETLQQWLASDDPLKKRIAEQKLFGSEKPVASNPINLVFPDGKRAAFDANTQQAEIKDALSKGAVEVGLNVQGQSLDSLALKEEQAQQTADIVTTKIGEARGIIEDSRAAGGAMNLSTGVIGSLSEDVPTSPSHRLAATIKTIEANLGFDQLQKMRQASPTGGALGNVTEKELDLLKSAVSNLSLSQGEEQLLQNLEQVEKMYHEVIHGKGGGTSAVPADTQRLMDLSVKTSRTPEEDAELDALLTKMGY